MVDKYNTNEFLFNTLFAETTINCGTLGDQNSNGMKCCSLG